jgi:hypothetical protein
MEGRMNEAEYTVKNFEYLKTNDLVPNRVNTPDSVEDSLAPHKNGEATSEPQETDAMNREREERIERFMNDVKNFIRKIDISQL